MGTERKQVVILEVSENMNGQVNPTAWEVFPLCLAFQSPSLSFRLLDDISINWSVLLIT